jgi:UDP-GlcNAc:undecaprenyl-phosphate GlcNAc-1-phosphate transferase
MYIRRRRGISMFLGSPDHFALRLRAWALTERQTVYLSYAAAALLSLAGGAVMYLYRRGALLVLLLLASTSLLAAVWLNRIKTGS